jgi:hypothetical protein
MPVRVQIDHGTRLVEASAEDSLSAEDVVAYLEHLAEEGAMPYAKLFDATGAKATMSVDELRSIGAWVRKYGMDGRGPVGPLAIVSESGDLDAAHFADAAGSNRPLRIFRDRAEAAAWLDQTTKKPGRRP